MATSAPPRAPTPYEPRPSGGAGRARRADAARQPHDGWTFVLIPPGTGARPHTLHISVRRLRALLWGGATMAGASVAVIAVLGVVLSAAPKLEAEARGVELGVLAAVPAAVAAPAESLAAPAVDSVALPVAEVAPAPAAPIGAPVAARREARRAETRETRESPRRRPAPPPFVGRREARVADAGVADAAEAAAPVAERTEAATSGFVSRLPVIGRISSNFSRARRHPLLGIVRRHQGVDIAAPSGTRITASAPGRVAFAGRRVGYGLVVELDHGNGVITRYAHCRSLLVRKGGSVAAGATIATVGRTGLASGPHLHYEVLVRGRSVDPLRTSLASLLRDAPADAPAATPAAAVPAPGTEPVLPAAPAGQGEGEGTSGREATSGRDSTRAEAPGPGSAPKGANVGSATSGG